nr:hypothetical protein Iba_chr11fCG13550 [Ipomoea batatas]
MGVENRLVSNSFLLTISQLLSDLPARRRPILSNFLIRNIGHTDVIFLLQSLLYMWKKTCAIPHMASSRILLGVLVFLRQLPNEPISLCYLSNSPPTCEEEGDEENESIAKAIVH